MSQFEKPMALGLTAGGWLGMILCTGYAIASYQGASFLSRQHLAGLPTGWKLPTWTAGNTLALVGLWACQMATLWQLRCIGSTLERFPTINPQTVRAFRRLAHALLALTVVALVAPAPHWAEVPDSVWMTLRRVDFPTMFQMSIACGCVYLVAHLLDESTRLKQENEGFV